MKIINMNI